MYSLANLRIASRFSIAFSASPVVEVDVFACALRCRSNASATSFVDSTRAAWFSAILASISAIRSALPKALATMSWYSRVAPSALLVCSFACASCTAASESRTSILASAAACFRLWNVLRMPSSDSLRSNPNRSSRTAAESLVRSSRRPWKFSRTCPVALDIPNTRSLMSPKTPAKSLA